MTVVKHVAQRVHYAAYYSCQVVRPHTETSQGKSAQRSKSGGQYVLLRFPRFLVCDPQVANGMWPAILPWKGKHSVTFKVNELILCLVSNTS